ncbi:histidine kinase dimerization/phosphoacceptor domain -containing protein [Methanobacterium sp.]|uniref:sensor histidine kinase n=1 Tax=Methanobacterium sp. TaxID=2164 RepID=UPI003C787606
MNFVINKNKFTSFRALSIFFAIALLVTAFIVITENTESYNNIFGNLAFFILNLIVIITLFFVTKKSFKYGRKAFISWTLIALSQLVTILGNVLWTIMYTELNKSPFPSIADILYLSYYPLLILGIFYLPVNRVQETKKYQILLDTGIMIISAGLVIWVFLISFPKVQDINTFNMLIYLFYVLMDIFMLFILSYLLFDWFGQVKKMPLLLLASSVTILVITNIIYIYQFLFTLYIPSNFLNIGWLSSYFLTALAGISYVDNKSESLLPSFKYKFSFRKVNWSSYLPMLWLSFIYILLYWIYTQLTNDNLNILVWGAAIILTMMFVRQILDLKESNQARKLLQKNQEILEKREKHLSLITDNMMDLITRIDAKGEYRYVSPSAHKALGYTPENMMGKNILDLVHPDDLERLKNSVRNAIHTHSSSEIEYRHKTSSGDYAWIETASTPIFDHENNLKGFVCGSRNINYRKHVEEQIKTSLEEKEVLLKEIHHRVKNNMQIISSLLSLQSRYIKDENYLAIFKESQDRVKSMAMIHEGLYKTNNLARINFKEYINNLISGLFSSYGIDQNVIKTNVNLDNILLDVDTAIPLGLILNELISNSLKHAFPSVCGQDLSNVQSAKHTVYSSEFQNFTFYSGEINISLSQDKNILKLVVSDNGIGFPESVNFRNTESLGLQLVNTLVNQLRGEIKLEKNNGTKFVLNLEKQRNN